MKVEAATKLTGSFVDRQSQVGLEVDRARKHAAIMVLAKFVVHVFASRQRFAVCRTSYLRIRRKGWKTPLLTSVT